MTGEPDGTAAAPAAPRTGPYQRLIAAQDKAEELAGSASGTILPFSYHPRLEVIADPALLQAPELFFNAARLDRSIALATEDYLRLAAPRIARITATP